MGPHACPLTVLHLCLQHWLFQLAQLCPPNGLLEVLRAMWMVKIGKGQKSWHLRVETRDATQRPTMPGTPHVTETSTPKCQVHPG